MIPYRDITFLESYRKLGSISSEIHGYSPSSLKVLYLVIRLEELVTVNALMNSRRVKFEFISV
jgi:hypothetical protein